jgi:hypothetical protein
VEEDVMGAPSELFHPDGILALSLRLPTEQPQFATGKQMFLGLLFRGGNLEGEECGGPQVREEPEKRLGALGEVDSGHAEVLERGEGIDHHALEMPPAYLLADRRLEGRHRHVDALEFGGLANREGDLSESNRFSSRGDVLERYPLVAHDVGDRVEHVDLIELGSHRKVVPADLVGRFFERDVQDLLPAPYPLDEELQCQGRFSGAGRSHEEVRAVREESPREHFVEFGDARRNPL